VSKEDILKLIEERGFVTILKEHDLTLWKVLETLDDLGYIFLERYEDEY
jgi:hypothetical protein